MDPRPQTVEIVGGSSLAITPGEIWSPSVGEETLSVLDSQPEDARARIQEEARSILSRSVDPLGEACTRAGLVVGYVQSGKTTSMITAAAMGRDNGFGLVVFIAGTSEILLGQSRKRLEAGLRLSEPDAYRRWVHFQSPKPGTEDSVRLSAALRDWVGGGEERATVLITVMKQHKHLKDLAEVFQEATQRVRFGAIPALVFDDEADLASPNLRAQPGKESATYRDLRRVRNSLQWHTLLQYTATPQAVLLISIADEISPEFTCVLAPGPGYVGGKYFFEEHRDDFVRVIPQSESDATGLEVDPPDTLFSALAVFALGAAVGLVDKGARGTQRSMLIHPSQATFPHARYVSWVRNTADQWAKTLEIADKDVDRLDLIEDVFAPAYADLKATSSFLPPLDQVLQFVPALLRKLRIEEVNARGGGTPAIPWSTGYAWALVGGQLLDRGFTVEGLTVTYMPRGLGVGHADTVQQRARFFGYKRDYAELCRAWLDPEVAGAFEAYVRHEESVRSGLAEATRTGKSLRDWKRVFLLDRSLKPTRAAVIRLAVDRPTFGDDWLQQRFVRAPDTDLNARNRAVVDSFLQRVALRPDEGHTARTNIQRHHVGIVSVGALFEELVSGYAMYDGDLPQYTALQMLIGDLDPALSCVVYEMSGGNARERALRPGTDVVEIFQGANSRNGELTYPGDREIREATALSVQIHHLTVLERSGGPTLEENVPALAFWVPRPLADDFLVAR
ncbi:hypothetical protein BH23CHL7_BH23CHL7_16000 [soil metagenome]